MSDAAWEVEKQNYTEKLKNWINLNVGKESSAAIFAMAEVLQLYIEQIDLTEIQKGAAVQDIVNAFKINNKINLALYNDFRKAKIEAKVRTKH